MTKILGLDLGTNSIGWALIEQEKKDDGRIIDIGSRIFPMGVNMEKGTKEVSKNATRRDKRQARRQNFRRKMRKEKLAELLIDKQMFPQIDPIFERLTGYNSKEHPFRNKFKTVLHEVQLPEELRSFFALDPYKLRAKAFEEDQLSLKEIGRIFYHFAQRRGYKENLQDDKGDGKIYEGKPKEGKTGITETKKKIEKYGTLGNYLHHEDSHKKRLRNRYTLRSMYEDEFNIIWANQQKYHPDTLTEELRINIGASKRRGDKKDGILFFQRPLRSQKHLIGNCTFESSKPRTRQSTIPFEQFRAHQIVNSIKDGHESLAEEDRAKAIDIFHSKKRAFKFSVLRKKLSNPDGNYNFADKDKLPGSPTIANFRKIFGAKKWADLSLKKQEDIWHIKLTADDPEWLEDYAQKKWGLKEKAINDFKSFHLKDDYANLSRKAIMNILPYLKQGYMYDEAVLLGGLRSAFGAHEWDQMEKEVKQNLEQVILDTAKDGEAKGKAIDRIKVLLEHEYNLPQKKLGNLYHHSVEKEVKVKHQLPKPENIRNPIVQQALFEVRTLVNAITEKHGEPDEIRVEMARELKASKSHREQIRQRQQEREEENNEIKKRLDEYGHKHTRTNIHKVLLWRECDNICPFTGEQIGFNELFDEGYVQIEHIIPYSISLNNSLQNKTLCLAYKNQEKGKQTPYQAFGENGEWEEMKSRAYRLFKKNNPKYRRFISKKNPDANDFIERQLNDTRYISKVAKNYLKHICSKVTVTPGTTTSMLRHFWGLDGILGDTYEVDDMEDGEYLAATDSGDNIIELLPWNKKTLKKDQKKLEKKGSFLQGYVKNDTFYPFKQRNDHRHHALDALAVACTEASYLNQIARLSRKGWTNRSIKENNEIEHPWSTFWGDANEAIQSILVSHKQNDRILTNVKKQLFDYQGNPKTDDEGNRLPLGQGKAARGQLHEETVYGKHPGKNGEEYFHARKPLDAINNSAKVNKIVDPAIRDLVRQAVKKADPSINLDERYSVPNHAFFNIDEETKKRMPLVHLPNKNGDPIPVKKVRIREHIGNAQRLKEGINGFVNPKNNHHVLLYENNEGELAEEVLTFWEVVERKAQKQNVVQLPPDGSNIITTLQINDLFLLNLKDEQVRDNLDNPTFLADYLYRVQKLSSKYYEFRLVTESTLDNKIAPYYHRIQSFGTGKTGWKRFNPVKINISPLGEITLANT